MPILIQANAKLNLNFKILKKRSDGFHEIKSVFQSINLSDFLFFKKSQKNRLSGEIVCPEEENTVLKAKKILEKELKKTFFCQIHLQKSIPVAAGLGGASADAAATLSALNLLYNLNISQKKLAQIGAKIGADVPFFFYGGTCQIKGIGEKITPLKQSLNKFFVVFRPHKRVETKKMYQLYDKTGKNFFQLNREICPAVKNLEEHLKKFSLKAKLSGSGPTLFCRLNDYQSAQKISQSYPNFNGDIFICQSENKALKIIK